MDILEEAMVVALDPTLLQAGNPIMETYFPLSTLTLYDEKGNVIHQVPK